MLELNQHGPHLNLSFLSLNRQWSEICNTLVTQLSLQDFAVFWNEVFNCFVTCKSNHSHSQFIFTPLRGRVRPHQGYKVSYVVLVILLLLLLLLLLVVVVVVVVVIVVVVVVFVLVVFFLLLLMLLLMLMMMMLLLQSILCQKHPKTLYLAPFLSCRWKNTGTYDVFAASMAKIVLNTAIYTVFLRMRKKHCVLRCFSTKGL